MFLNKADKVEDKELLELVSWKCGSCSPSMAFRGMMSRWSLGSAIKAIEGDQSEVGVPSIVKLLEAVDTYIPDAGASH